MTPHSLILGGAGFIGSHLSEALLREGHRVTIFDKIGIDTSNIKGILKKVKFIEGDFLDEWFLDSLTTGVDYVFHLVSTTLPATSNLNPVYDVKSNLAPSIRLIDRAAKNRVKKFIFISSGGTIYGVPKKIPTSEAHPTNPITSYAITKLGVEKFLHLYNKLHGLDYAVLRVANPYGPRQPSHLKQGIVAVFMSKILSGEPVVVWGDGLIQRDYVFIDDVIEAFVSAIKEKTEARIYNIGSGIGTNINELIELLRSVAGDDFKIEYRDARPADVPVSVLDISLAKDDLKWKPSVDLKQGLGLTWDWYKERLGK